MKRTLRSEIHTFCCTRSTRSAPSWPARGASVLAAVGTAPFRGKGFRQEGVSSEGDTFLGTREDTTTAPKTQRAPKSNAHNGCRILSHVQIETF